MPMVVIEYIKDRKGTASHGHCSACFTPSEEDERMVRIKFFEDKCGLQMQMHRFNLCQKCYKELKDEMMKFEGGVKG